MSAGQQKDEQLAIDGNAVVSTPNASKETDISPKNAEHEQDARHDDDDNNENDNNVKEGKDVNKDGDVAADSDEKKDTDADEDDQYAVSWGDRPEDNPMSWTMAKKWRIIGTLSVLSLLT